VTSREVNFKSNGSLAAIGLVLACHLVDFIGISNGIH